MRFKLSGNKADSEIHIVKNADTVVIPRGTPLCLQLGATADDQGDGLDVVLPSTAGATGFASFPYGVATRNMAPGEVGESIVFGIVRYALTVGMTRSATSANWPAVGPIAAGAVLQLDSVNNVFLVGAAVAPAAAYLPFAILLDQISVPSQASATTGPYSGATMQPIGVRVFVRML